MSLENTLVVVLVGFMLVAGFGPLLWQGLKQRSVARDGVDAVGQVLSVVDTGRKHNLDPVVRVTVRVAVDADGYEAAVTQPASAVTLQWLKTGARVAVRYRAGHPDQIAILGPAEPES